MLIMIYEIEEALLLSTGPLMVKILSVSNGA